MAEVTHANGQLSDELHFPIDVAPERGGGSAVELRPGLFWLRMPVGGSLDHINIWALKDQGGWAVVDTGLRSPEAARAWRMALQGLFADEPVTRVIVTHLHPDHSGMAGWIVNKTGAKLWMTRLEYLTLRVLANDTGREAPAEAIDFYREAGWDDAALDHYRTRFGDFGKVLYPLPNQFHRLAEGDVLRIGDREWRVVVAAGHSPEHACLYCEDEKLFISGDQILPAISSNVSVQPLEPEADPLSDWLSTLARIRDLTPADVLVLPSHGEPFVGLHERINKLIAGHERALERVLSALDRPARAVDMFPQLFRRTITHELLFMATGESLAHLNYLRARGQVTRSYDADGVAWWVATGSGTASAG